VLPLPEGSSVVFVEKEALVLQVEALITGDLSDYADEQVVADLTDIFRDITACYHPVCTLALRFESASVRVTADIVNTQPGDYDIASDNLGQTSLSLGSGSAISLTITMESLNAALQASGNPILQQAESLAVSVNNAAVALVVVAVAPPPPLPPPPTPPPPTPPAATPPDVLDIPTDFAVEVSGSDRTALIAGLCVGLTVFVLLIGGGMFMYKKNQEQQMKKVVPAGAA